MIVLRPYQVTAVARARSLINSGRRKVLLCAPCGAGKGAILAHLLERASSNGKRSLALVHRRELVEDLAERIEALGFKAGLILPGHDPRPERKIQVASVQTLAKRDRPVADLVLVDECHHATADSWRSILESYPHAAIVGTTATPCRMSGAPLGDVFDELVEVIKPSELVDLGFLVPCTGFAFDAPDLRGLRRIAGDYDQDELGALMGSQKIRGSVVGHYLSHARGMRAIVFAVNVAHAEALAAEFRAAGVKAQSLDGEAPRKIRSAVFESFRSGALDVLCNVGLFTEGVDLPAIQCVILARPTLSLSLALQMIGRGRRPVPCACGAIPHWRLEACACGRPVAKRVARIHDHAGVILQHGLPDEPRIWTLSGDYRIGAKAKGAKGAESAALRTCRKCFAIYLADQDRCELCGHRNPKTKRLIKSAQGVAIPLASLEVEGPKKIEADEDQRRRFYFYLLGEAKRKGYRDGWCTMRYHARFHRWPVAKLWRAMWELDQAQKGAQQ